MTGPLERFDEMARRVEHLAALVAEIQRREIPVAIESVILTELAGAAKARNIGQMKRLFELISDQFKKWRPVHGSSNRRAS